MTLWHIDVRRGAGRVEVSEAEDSEDACVVGNGGSRSGAIYRWDPDENRWSPAAQLTRRYVHPAISGFLLCRDGAPLEPSMSASGQHYPIVYGWLTPGLYLFFNESIEYRDDGDHICVTEQVVFVVHTDGLRPNEVPRSAAPPDTMTWTRETRLFERRDETVSGVPSTTNRYIFEPDRPQE